MDITILYPLTKCPIVEVGLSSSLTYVKVVPHSNPDEALLLEADEADQMAEALHFWAAELRRNHAS